MPFLHPHYLHALWLLPLLVLLRIWSGRTARTATDAFVAWRLRELLVAGASPVRMWTLFVLQMLALTGFVVATAQPRWGEEKREITETGKNVIIAIDTSRSMLADDVKPNRLLRAKLAAEDILGTLHTHRVGLIAFAGRAYLQAPLTTDHEAVSESIQALDTNTIPHGGTSISEAIREALTAFSKTSAHNHGFILFSDGGDEDSELEQVLKEANEKHMIILTVGVGTQEGSLIPDPEPGHSGDFIRDPATGMPVHSRLEEGTLQKIAGATGGRYLKLGSQALNASVVAEVLSTLDSLETGNRQEVKPIERFYWPLSVGILCLMIALLLRPTTSLPRLPPAMALLACLLVFQPGAQAALFGSTGPTPGDALDAYKSQDYMRARELYSRLLTDAPAAASRATLAYGLGAASHQLKDYDRAIDGFSQALESKDSALQTRAHQGLGTTLYDQGVKSLQQQPELTEKAWTDSLQHFDDATKLSNDRNLVENRDFVKKQLAELKQQMEQQKEKKKKGKGDKNKEPGDGSGDKGQKDDEGEGNDSKDGKKGDPKDGKQQDGGQKDSQQDGKEGKDGKQQEAQQGKEGEDKDGKQAGQTPEGKIQAGEAGKHAQKSDAEGDAEAAEEKKQEVTGFSRNEARNLLRTYDDQTTVQNKTRRERTVAKDW